MKLAILCIFAAVLVASAAGQQPCPVICPQIYAPLCARNTAGDIVTFASDCDLEAKNCLNKSDFVKQRSGAC